MFRKPKRKVNTSLRRKDADDAEEEPETSELLEEARKRTKSTTASGDGQDAKTSSVMHTYQAKDENRVSNAELATSTAQHHALPEDKAEGSAAIGPDGIWRDATRNKMHAGPIRAAAHVRVTARFDYQPDICKDYKDTGFCGFGDTCIYLHDRTDTLSGWQIEQQWEEEQKHKKAQQEKELESFMSGKKTTEATSIPDDGLPFACHLCRERFKDPVVTNCGHYFCERCIMDHVRSVSDACPICGKDTASVFNQPTKLMAKKRKVVGRDGSWDDYYRSFAGDDVKHDST